MFKVLASEVSGRGYVKERCNKQKKEEVMNWKPKQLPFELSKRANKTSRLEEKWELIWECYGNIKEDASIRHSITLRKKTSGS